MAHHGDVNCKSSNIAYIIECNIERCKQRYVVEPHKKLYDRFSEHLGYLRTKKLKKTTGAHYGRSGHNISNMRVTILEEVRSTNWHYRKEREKYIIRKFNTIIVD